MPLQPNGISDLDILLFVFGHQFCFQFSVFWFRFSIAIAVLSLAVDVYGGREWPLKVRTQKQKSISKSNNSKLKVDC